MAFPVTGIVYRFWPTISHSWLPKCFWNAAWFMHNDWYYSNFSSFLHQEIERKFPSVFEKEILPSNKVHLACCYYNISVICTANGNENIFLVLILVLMQHVVLYRSLSECSSGLWVCSSSSYVCYNLLWTILWYYISLA